jgi:outer membrane protein assembly factor BamB
MKKRITLTCLLTLTIIFGILALPLVFAQEAQTVKTYAFINAIPNPVGVNQEVLLHVGITMPLFSIEMGWENLEVIIVCPNGTTKRITGIKTDSTGGTGVTFKPDAVGNYTLKTHFPEQVTTPTKIAGSFEVGIYPPGTVFLESYSDPLTLVVQETPVPGYPGFPLPMEYWTRPIDSQIREWYTIAGNWLDSTPRKPVFVTGNDYAPESPHVLWAKPLTTGGLVGDPIDEHGFEIGDAYEGKWRSKIILAGRLYYQDGAANELWQRVICVDLHTGEEIWRKTFLDNRTIAFGQVMYWDTPNYHGVYDYLWVIVGTTWHAFDAFTGDWVYAIENAPVSAGELFWGVPDRLKFGPKGEILVYTINLQGGWMTLWNSSHLKSPAMAGFYAHSWRPYGYILNGTEGYMWNKTIPKVPGVIHQYFGLDRVVGGLLTRTKVVVWGISLKPGEEGTLLYNKTWTPPAEWEEGDLTPEFNIASAEYGVYVIRTKENRQYYGFSTKTGDKLWGPTPSEHYLNYYGWIISPLVGERAPLIAYGRLYSTGVSGIVYCYNVTTGQLLWTYTATDPYNEILWNNAWWLHPLFITDGKIYFGSMEHSPIDPKPRGAPFICLNATTGDEIFRVDGLIRQTWWGGMAIIGDSIIATMDTYDQRIYAIGKGPSATTVTAPDTGITVGTSIVIRGTVMDISPGTRDIAIQMRFPNGVPAVADECMGDWMLYVYKQQFPRPTNVEGVWVKLDAINVYTGEYIDIGGTHTDSTGMFCVSWNPPKEGLWTILATFPGSKSYYPSFAQTAITVTGAPAAPAAPAYTTMDLAIMVAVVIAIIIGIYSIYDHRKLKK